MNAEARILLNRYLDDIEAMSRESERERCSRSADFRNESLDARIRTRKTRIVRLFDHVEYRDPLPIDPTLKKT